MRKKPYNKLKVRLCLTSLDDLMQAPCKRSNVITVEIGGRFIECNQLGKK